MKVRKAYTGAGNEVFYYGDWIQKPNVAICSCYDVLRTVVSKLEATDDNAKNNYTQYVKCFLLDNTKHNEKNMIRSLKSIQRK